MGRRRIVFFAEAVTLAHVARPYVLAKALDPAVYDVHIACDPRFSKLFADSSFPHHPIYSIPCEQFNQRLARGRPIYDQSALRRFANEDLRVLDEIRPDLVVGDFRISLGVTAEVARVPYLTISNAYWSPFSRQHPVVPELSITRLLGVGPAQGLFNIVRPLVFAHHSRPMNRLRREFGLPPFGPDLRRAYTHADHTLYADIPGLFPMAPLPACHYYLGPVLWSPSIAAPLWWEGLPAKKPVVYVTLGSSGASELLPRVLEAMAGLPLTVVAATAGRLTIANPPHNARLAEYLPGETAAARAKLVICNGGSPTTQQALYAGRPVLGLPSNLDQCLNMSAIAGAEAGIMLRPQYATPDRLRASVNRLLWEPQFSENASALAKRFREYDSGERFAGLVGRILRTAGSCGTERSSG